MTVLVFGQTLTVHPAVTALVESSSGEHNMWTDKFFLPVTCFLVNKRDSLRLLHILISVRCKQFLTGLGEV